MSPRPFTAYFPRNPEAGDEVKLRAKLKEDARSFSVNFCLARPDNAPNHVSPPYIALHFKTIYAEDGTSQVVQNWKDEFWQQEEHCENYWHTDRSKPFTVIFRMHEEKVKLFVECVDHMPDYEFTLHHRLEDIATIELWDDVESVDEISFRFANQNSW